MNPPWMPAKGPMTIRLAAARLEQLMFHATMEDDGFLDMARRQIPQAWRALEMDVDVAEPKEKVTLYLDRSVVKMFRSMGQGYQARINRVLATWMQMKIAGKVEFEQSMLEAIKVAGEEKEASEDAAAATRGAA